MITYKSNPGLPRITSVLKTADDRLTSQAMIPFSPAAFDDTGNVCLCAAGILCHSGIKVYFGEDQANTLADSLARTRDKR